jgi:hypothetical protein
MYDLFVIIIIYIFHKKKSLNTRDFFIETNNYALIFSLATEAIELNAVIS